MDGCSNQSIAHGLCKRHRARCCCNVINCTKSVFKHNTCQSHYSPTNKSSTMTNESITVSTTDPITESSIVTTNLFTVTNQSNTVITNESNTVTNEPCAVANEYLCKVSNKASTVTTRSSTVTEINIVVQQVIEFVGIGIWEQVHTFAAVWNCGDILLYPICPILGKFQWMVERKVDWTLVQLCAIFNQSIPEMRSVFLSRAEKPRSCWWMT